MLKLCFYCVLFLLMASLTIPSATAYEVGDWTVDQVTSNDVHDSFPQTDGSRIIWSGTGPNGTNQIFIRENGVISQISHDIPGGVQPRISTEIAAWTSFTQVFRFDEVVEELTPSWESHGAPQVSGHRVAWLGQGDTTIKQVYVNDGLETRRLTETDNFKYDVCISDTVVAWRGIGPSGTGDIFYHDGTEIHTLTNNDINEKYPKISHDAAGMHLTYEAYIDGQWDIMHFDGTSTVNLTGTPGIDESQHQSCGSRTVWRQYSGGQYRIMLHDGSGIVELDSASWSLSDPQVSESLVVWTGGYYTDIFVNDGMETTQLTDTYPWSEEGPQVCDNTIVWFGSPEGDDREIFTAYPSSSVVSNTPESMALQLHGASPNPFNPCTEIKFSIPREETISIRVFDIRGRSVANLGQKDFASGQHAVTWDATNDRGQRVPSGVYFYRVSTLGGTQIGKVTLME